MAKTIELAVFGHPITHSLSPQIHSQFAQSLGLHINYQAIDCPAGQLFGQLQRFRAGGGHGCSVTVPLKHEALACATTVKPSAKQAGAANTLIWNENAWQAHNTDGIGLLADFKRLKINVSNQRILIIGAGGAAAGILPALLNHGPKSITLSNRSKQRALSLAASMREFFPQAPVTVISSDESSDEAPFDLVIQATSQGHHGQCPAIQKHWLAPNTKVYDLNYGPAHQPLQAWCDSNSIRCIGGSGMLVEQAATAFELFAGQRPDTGLVHEWIQAL